MLFCLPLPSFRAPIPLWAHWNHVGLFPHLSVLILIIRAETLLPCEEIYSQVPRSMFVFAEGWGWGAWFCHDFQAGLDTALAEIGVRVEVGQWPRQEQLRVLMRPCIQSGRGERRGPCECVGVDEASRLPSLCLRLQYVLVMLSEESCTAEVAGFS